jgi:hypothetical protein
MNHSRKTPNNDAATGGIFLFIILCIAVYYLYRFVHGLFYPEKPLVVTAEPKSVNRLNLEHCGAVNLDLRPLRRQSEDAVRGRLITGSTAEFPGFFQSDQAEWVVTEDCHVLGQSWVAAQNDLGQYVRTTWRVDYKIEGGRSSS